MASHVFKSLPKEMQVLQTEQSSSIICEWLKVVTDSSFTGRKGKEGVFALKAS